MLKIKLRMHKRATLLFRVMNKMKFNLTWVVY
jgi:hypothetical protein